MNDKKPWYLSMGVWGGLIAALMPVVTAVFALDAETAALLAQQTELVIGGVVTVVGGLAAIYGRVRAKSEVTMKKTPHFLIPFALMFLVGACAAEGDDRSTLEVLFPRTTAGLAEGGVVGAVEGFTGGVGVICSRLDDAEFVAAVDTLAMAIGVTEETEKAREKRQDVCDAAVAANNLAGVWTATEVVALEVAPAPPTVE